MPSFGSNGSFIQGIGSGSSITGVVVDPTPCLRLIIHAYTSQYCRVWYNNIPSQSFLIKNGIGKGKVMAGFTYFLYCRDLLDILENSGYGLRIKGLFAGAVWFSDDDLLLAPTVSTLQEMIKIMDKFTLAHTFREKIILIRSCI